LSRAGARTALVAALAAPPLLLLGLPEGLLAPGLAYLAHDARVLLAFPAVLALAAYLFSLEPLARAARRLRECVERACQRAAPLARGWLSLVSFVAAFFAALVLMPDARRNATAFGGDEPKYLRMAESLLRDMDVDVASQHQQEWTPGRQLTGLRRLVRETGEEIPRLFQRSPTPEHHRWNLGNWTLQGLHGGQYYVQSPGLPLLLLPSLIAREILAPDRPPAFLPLFTLAALWSFAFVQTVRLASEASGSGPAGLSAAAVALLSAPLLLGGFHFYPESAAVALVPWLLRHARRPGAAPGAPLAAALGLGCGLLPWLHPKFLLIALVLLALLARRLQAQRAALSLLLAGAAFGLITLALFDHHVTGLLLPDAFYRRYGASFYGGPASLASPLVVNGLVTALFGARDGLLVMAPGLIGGVLAAVVCWRTDRRATLELGAVFGALWVAAAVHEGGAPGPPGRLMAPVACVLAAFLAVGLARLRSSAAYRLAVIALSALSISISVAMLRDWRRTVNPYREMFTVPQRDFAKDLPDGPGRAAAPLELHKSRDRLRGALLVSVLFGWAWLFARPPEGERPLELRLAGFCLGLWATVALLAATLSALGPGQAAVGTDARLGVPGSLASARPSPR
jgi:hypothetical protein